jgi:hypothetical protein
MKRQADFLITVLIALSPILPVFVAAAAIV